jgi:hypothetical protein
MRSLRLASALVAALIPVNPIASFATAPQNATSETAAQFYLRWRATALNAKSVDEISAFWTADTKDQFNMEPDSAKADTLAMAKRFLGMQTDVRVVKETATPSGATLSLEAVDRDKKPVVSSVDIVKENGAWKMTAAVERWKPKDGEPRLARSQTRPSSWTRFVRSS